VRLLLASFISCAAFGQTFSISTFAGGVGGLPGNILATAASLGNINGLAVDAAGNVFMAGFASTFFPSFSAILRLDRQTGVLTTVAGSGSPGFQRR
jgi:hypothetical protein